MSKYQAYAEYKNINNKWLDKIPSHWEITHIKHILSMPITDGPHSTPIFLDEGIPFVSAEAVSSGRINFNKIRGHISEKDDEIFSQKYSPRLHDVYMIKSGATTGITAIVETQKRFNIWSPLAVMRCKESYNPYFLLNSLRSDFFQKSVQLSWTFGTQQNIGMGTLENLTVCYPPLAEQTQIAVFLDYETAKIDTLIEKQQQLIKLLKEKRQAVISHAVTKGLNPQAPMKDSGVEWLGEVPEHWRTAPLKHISKIRYGIGEPPKYRDSGIPLIRATNIRSGKISEVNLVLVDPNDIPSQRIVWLTEGDIIVVRSGAGTGDSSIIPRNYAGSIAGFDMVVSPTKCTPRFLGYALLSNYIRNNQIDLEKTRAAQPHLNAEELGDCFVLLPSETEQDSISNYIEQESFKFDVLINKATSTITLMQERRTALISAAVTGKIDVRNWIAPTTSSDENEAAQEVTA
ncbi:restriction endonuclease subunit S [Photobacterium kishitanii]|uniref:restriction endonuclease subunit S n=1 Tax=Photobacterium kishitanii TaxID=318456 RepID=UPI0004322743|nr:restriction endonuclease subunit S [Photobacterium kishitanii]CEO40536.1 conserved hypothetical protein [Photobacterium kishitanii]